MPTASAFTAPVYITLKMAPVITLDSKNGGIAQGFMDAAGILAKFYNYKDPQLLNGCDDVFAMPHADPTWATHSNLYYWNKTRKGAIWAGCHAVSVLPTFTQAQTDMGMALLPLMAFLPISKLLAVYPHTETTDCKVGNGRVCHHTGL